MNPFNIPVSALSNTGTVKTDHMHQFSTTPSDLHNSLSKSRLELIKVMELEDQQLSARIKDLIEIMGLIQDLIEVKEKSK